MQQFQKIINNKTMQKMINFDDVTKEYIKA